MLIRLAKESMDQYYNPITSMLPFLNDYNLVNPYKSYSKNLQEFKSGVAEMMKESKDPESVNFKLTNYDECSFKENLDDLCLYMFAGTETSAHTLTSFFYFLKKNPEVHKKLLEEFKENGLEKGKDFSSNVTLENIQNLNYLNCCVKEVLRIDSPAIDTFNYMALDDIKICEVPIPKGTILKLDIYTAHYDNSKWLNPLEFIPERHDSESEFYQKSKQAGKVADVYSRRTFSHGMRNCPGMALAMLEIKVFMISFLAHINFEFDQEIMSKEGIGFGMGSHFDPMMKVTKL
mmetsp:Transcript_24556/g.27225  ORF Transcript_24556/g.27225 Transcript_24556/m.27225 type:complete len:290 (+) Transcript_24556:151-1020(+)